MDLKDFNQKIEAFNNDIKNYQYSLIDNVEKYVLEYYNIANDFNNIIRAKISSN